MSTQPRKPAGSPNATGGQYDFKTGMDQPPRLPAAYFDGSMDDDERAMWAEGIDAAREGWADNHQEFDKDGNKVQSRVIRERLLRESEVNVAIKVEDTPGGEAFIVSGRGELQMGVLIENMRREGFELSISRPRDGDVAILARPGRSDLQVAMPMRTLQAQLIEELRTVNDDLEFADVIQKGLPLVN